jgi:AAA domain
MSTLSNDQLVARLAELEAENLAHEKRERARSDAAVYAQRQILTSHVSLGDRAHDSLLRTQGRQHAGISIPAYPLLSNALFGLRGVTLLTAPYGIGKTTLTLNIARSVAAATVGKCPVVYFTTEMPAVRLAQRMIADIAASLLVKGGGNPLTMRQLLTGDSGLPQSAKDKKRKDGELQLGELQAKNYEAAREIFKGLDGKSLHILDAKDIGSMQWARSEGEHSLTPLQRKVDEVTEGAEEVLIILDTIAHLEIQPSGAGGEIADYKDDLSQDRDITAGLREWREHLGETRALLAVHEESKARTGSGEGHSIRGSSRYAYGADALIQLIYADSGERNSNGGGGGSVDLKLRDPVSKDRIATAQIDAVINKARDGGYAGTLIAFDHEYDRALVKEVASYSRNEQKNKKKEARAEQKEERNLAQKRLEYQSGEKKPAKKERT